MNKTNTKIQTLALKYSLINNFTVVILIASSLIIHVAKVNAISLGNINAPIATPREIVGDYLISANPLDYMVQAEETETMTVQKQLMTICQEKGYGENCAKTLLGMMWKESSGIATAIGDQGKARGYFQIHYKLHKISIRCAENLECSARWSLNYLEQNNYPQNVEYAVQCHNGCNANNGYAKSALRFGKTMWSRNFENKLAVVK